VGRITIKKEEMRIMGVASNGKIRQDIIDYIDATPWGELGTVRGDGTPVIRTIGAFALDKGGTSIYFATFPGAEKTRQISENRRVSFFFQHEGQQLLGFRNVEVLGDAGKVSGDDEATRVAALISARSPFVKEHIEKNGVGAFEFYEVKASEVKFLDYSKGIGPQAIEVIAL
jgi:nitroimidazol reductase NimA-like FMN-containing flavoprotein (pyridoxamine 5'-phosphate oxidase superfamily)